MDYQNLELFEIPPGFRGASPLKVQLWWAVQSSIFRYSPQVLYGWRRFLLRLFGAKVGKGVIIRSTATVTYPWKVQIGDFSWIGDNVTLYSLGRISVGSNACISQGSYLCGGDHNYKDPTFLIRAGDIVVEDQAWICASVFILPGVRIGRGAVVAATSSVSTDLPPGMICSGFPAIPVRPRVTEGGTV